MKDLRHLALCLVVSISFSCATPPEDPIDDTQLVSSLESRTHDMALLRQALSQVSVGELSLLPSNWEDIVSNPNTTTYWQARALAWERNSRQARWSLAVELAKTESAGFPDPIEVSQRTDDLSDLGLNNQINVVFDLLGILGLGRAPAEAALARRECRAALGALELSTWRANFDVLGALVDLACAQGKESDLSLELKEARRGKKRAQELVNMGRIGVADQSRIDGFLDLLGSTRADTAAEVARFQSRMATASGLLANSQAIRNIDSQVLDAIDSFTKSRKPEPSMSALLNSHPQLRLDRLNYAVTEAKLRSVAAEAWPKVGLGPRFEFNSDSFLTGGILRLSFPWPGSIGGLIEAAAQERAAARARLQDSLLDVTAKLRQASRSRRVLEQARVSRVIPAYQASAITWRGQQARFQVDEKSWDLWTDSLNLRRRAIIAYWDNRRDCLKAAIEEMRHGQGSENP